MELLKALIVVSEKAANIARLLRQNDRLFKRLIEVKSNADANPKFREDFKTLADVLIQEMVKHDIGLQFPSIRDKIYGEENNHFFNQTTNKEVIVEVKGTKDETAELLEDILDNDTETANLLATEVHRDVTIEEVYTKIPDQDFDIDVNKLGIWIDPIDGTNEYVKGTTEDKVDGFYLKGLQCVTVLIGVYDSNTGIPVVGVINQPFFEKDVNDGYQCNWGVCTENKDEIIKMSSLDKSQGNESKFICVASTENSAIVEVLKTAGYNLLITRGAGYKLLTVILGLTDAYILSKPTTYLWDTCAPQAVLRALGGDIVEMQAVANKEIRVVRYEVRPDDTKDNRYGIVAYRNKDIFEKLMELPWGTIHAFNTG